MKRIEMLTDVRDDGGYIKGEIRIVTPEKAGYFCGLGWARDLSNEIATGKQDLSDKKLDVQSVQNASKTSKIGVKNG